MLKTDIKIPKYKKVLLINPWESDFFPPPSIGYLQSSIKSIFKDMIEVESRDLNDAIVMLKNDSFDLVGVTFHSFSIKYAKLIKSLCKSSTHLICGGHHPSSLPDQMIDIGYDQVVIGEGENSIIDIILGKEKNKKVYDRKSYFKSIDDLPFPDYTGLNGDWRNIDSYNGYPIISSRGCIYNCNFCASSFFWNRKIYMRSSYSVISEIIYNIENFNMNRWMFEDDNFTFNKKRVKEICKGIVDINNKYGKKYWQCSSRADTLNDEELCRILVESGCKMVWIGVESFSQDTLNRCKKNVSVERMVSGIKTAESIGLSTMCQFIVGLPGDTIKNIIETSEIINKIKMTRIGVNIAWVLPNTDIYNKSKYYGFDDNFYLDNGAPFFVYENDINILEEWKYILYNSWK